MSTTTPDAGHDAHADEHADEHTHVHPDSYYIKLALILAVLTALETSTYWLIDELGAFLVPSLIIMMVIKFVMVASIFMHLKFDHKIFTWMFYSGLVLAILVYVAFLTTFRFFG